MNPPQFGVLIGLALSPVLIHQQDTTEVCGNETYTPPPSPALFADWSGNINSRMFYYLLGQAVIAFIILLFTIVGKSLHAWSELLLKCLLWWLGKLNIMKTIKLVTLPTGISPLQIYLMVFTIIYIWSHPDCLSTESVLLSEPVYGEYYYRNDIHTALKNNSMYILYMHTTHRFPQCSALSPKSLSAAGKYP